MTPVFLDTVGVLAIFDEDDQWHAAASVAYQPLVEQRRQLVTIVPVLVECANAAARRTYRADVVALYEQLALSGGMIELFPEDWDRAWRAYAAGEAGYAGLVDQLSFVVMRRLGLRQAFTNDRHFAAAGFEPLF